MRVPCNFTESKEINLAARLRTINGAVVYKPTLPVCRLLVGVAGRSPELRYGERQGCVGWTRANRATTAVELVGTSNKSECTRESEMPGACLALFS